MKKIVVFQLSHNTTPNQDKLRRFSSSVRWPKKAGEVSKPNVTQLKLIYRSRNEIYGIHLVRVMDTNFQSDNLIQ